MNHFKLTGSVALILFTTAAYAAEPEPARNTALDAVLNCRKLADPAQRLACFDKSVDSLQTANANRDIVVVDRGEIRKARRSLFGFNVPSLKIFGSDQDRKVRGTPAGIEGEDDEINTTITSAHRDANGNWVVTLADGAVWRQTDGTIALGPRAGGAITIRRAALGSYFMRIGKQPGVKARREN